MLDSNFISQLETEETVIMDLKNFTFDELSKLGRTAWRHSDWRALQLIVKVMRSKRDHQAETEFLQGLATKNISGSSTAIRSFKSGLNLDDSRHDCAIELTAAYAANGENAKAFELLTRYENKLSNSPIYLNMAGTTYITLGLPAKAFPLYQGAHNLQPEVQLFKENLASCATFIGKLELAIKLYEELLSLNPNHQRNLYQLSRLVKATDTGLIERIQKSIVAHANDITQNIFGYYALAKQYEDLGEWDLAFDQLMMGAKAVSAAAPHDVSTDIDILKTARATARPISTGAGSSITSAQCPIFIIGLPRTGTTLLEHLLASHSLIETLGETNAIEAGILELTGNRGKRLTADILEEASSLSPRALRNHYLDATQFRLEGLPFFIEKMPTNYQYLHLIANAFPEAKIILINRHPIDACFAMFKQLFTYAFRFTYSLEHLKNYYGEYQKAQALWRQLYPQQIVEVSYESLVTETQTCLEALFSGMGLDFESSILSKQQDPFESMTASSIQVKNEISTESIGRWEAYRKHLTPIIDLEI